MSIAFHEAPPIQLSHQKAPFSPTPHQTKNAESISYSYLYVYEKS